MAKQMEIILTNPIAPLDSCAALRIRKSNGAHFRSAVKDRKSWETCHYTAKKKHGISHINPQMRMAGKDMRDNSPDFKTVLLEIGKAQQGSQGTSNASVLAGISDLSYNPRAHATQTHARAAGEFLHHIPQGSKRHKPATPQKRFPKGNSTTSSMLKALEPRKRDGGVIEEKEATAIGLRDATQQVDFSLSADLKP